MHDNCDQFIQAMKMRLATMVEPDIASEIIEAMTYELRDYDLTRKSTEIVPYCDDNEKAVKSFLTCLIVEGKSKGTVKQYDYSLKRLFDFCGNKKYNLISQRDILAWLASLKLSGNKPTTVKNQRSNISSFFTWMFNNGYIDTNPCVAVRPIKVPLEEKRAFSSEELDTIRSACKNDYERAFIELLYASGMRIKEVAQLKLEDVDFNDLVIHIKNGKGAKDRTTYLNPVARKYVKAYLQSNKHHSEYVFTTKLNDRYTEDGMRKTTQSLTKRCGFLIHPHRFRRTLASDLALKGMPIQEIQKLLGHTSIETTKKYIDVKMNKVEASYRQYVA